jgi:hypothetical protein
VKIAKRVYIGGKENPLLVRYILFRIGAVGVYLHKLCRSDHDRALHDHPWPFVSVLLTGGYHEIHDQTKDREQVTEYRKRGSVLLRPAEWRHRLLLDKPVWTLIIVGRRARKWGFFTSNGWCWWRKYNYELNICEDEIIWEGGSD